MVTSGVLQIKTIELVLHRRESDGQHILLLWWKALGQHTIVSSLGGGGGGGGEAE